MKAGEKSARPKSTAATSAGPVSSAAQGAHVYVSTGTSASDAALPGAARRNSPTRPSTIRCWDLYATAADTLRFLRALVSGTVFDDPATLGLMQRRAS